MKRIIKISIFLFILLISGVKTVKALAGIDVSEWQGTINFEDVKRDNIEIVYIRSSAGNAYVDAKFEENYELAKEQGLKIGFYHYVTARNQEEAKEQARFFAHITAGKIADCRLAMDYESFRGLTREEINEVARTFLETLEELTEKELVIYSDAYNARYTFDSKLFDKYPLWVAEYDRKEPESKNWIGWQYTDRGIVSGIRGNVDRDEFKEDIYLSDKSAIKTPELKENEKIKTLYYRVKYGDTLSKIAKEYNTTVRKIVFDNKIKNPNLIFPDEILKIETNYEYKGTNEGEETTKIVRYGDTLTKIAYQNKVLVPNLVTWNKIKNPNLIYPKQTIRIRPRNNSHVIRYIVKYGDTLSNIAEDYKTSLYELIKINKIKHPNYIRVGEVIYIPETYLFEK